MITSEIKMHRRGFKEVLASVMAIVRDLEFERIFRDLLDLFGCLTSLLSFVCASVIIPA